MTPMQHSQYSHLPPSEGSHGRFDLHSFLPAYEASSFPCAIFRSPCQGDPRESDHPQQEAHEQFRSSGSTWHSGRPTSLPITKDDESRRKNDTSSGAIVIPSKSGSVHWVSSKMKMVRKVMNPDRIANSNPGEGMLQAQDQQQSVIDNDRINKNSHSPPSGIIRVCSDCNTTKTPLWRSGPRGPKSLCNACGIRQRKARRAMAAAAGLIPAVMPAKPRKEKIVPDGERTIPFKKRCKFTSAQTTKELHFDDFAALSLSKTSELQRVFPQDEKDAAILLMALSCGLIRG